MTATNRDDQWAATAARVEEARRAEIARRVAQSKREILDDIRDGVMPSEVASFTELHDHVDANEYGGLTTDGSRLDTWTLNAIQGAVDLWLQAGRPS